MRRYLLIGLAALAVTTGQPQAAFAQSDYKIINDPSRLDWDYYGGGYSLKPLRDPTIPGGGAAVEIKVDRGSHPYDAGANIPIGPIVEGRDYVVRIWARTLTSSSKGGNGKVLVRFFRNQDPFPGFGDTMIDIGPEWKTYEVHAKANQSIASAAAVGLQLAGAKQTIQIGQATVAEGVSSLGDRPIRTTGPDPIPPQIADKGSLINDPLNRQWVTYGKTLATAATVTNVYTRRATLMAVSGAGTHGYDAGVNVPIRDAISKGDRLIIAVLARTRSASTADGLGQIHLRLQSNQAPYPGFGEQPIQLTSGWRLYQWKVASEMDLSAGQGEVAIHAGLIKQEIEIGPVYVIREP